jgi:hypothetical protein
VKRIPGFKLSALLTTNNNQLENLSAVANSAISKGKKALKRKSLTDAATAATSSVPTTTTTLNPTTTLHVSKENNTNINLEINCTKKVNTKKPRLSLLTPSTPSQPLSSIKNSNSEKSHVEIKLASPKTTSLSLRNSNTAATSSATSSTIAATTKTRQSSVDAKSDKEEKNLKSKKTSDTNTSNSTTTNTKETKQTKANESKANAAAAASVPTKNLSKQKQSNAIQAASDETNLKLNNKTKNDHHQKASLTLDLVTTSSNNDKLFLQQESSSSDSGVALSLMSPIDESSLSSNLYTISEAKSKENVKLVEEKSLKRKSRFNNNLNAGGGVSVDEKSDDLLNGANLNLITPSASSVSSVSSVSSSCSSNSQQNTTNNKGNDSNLSQKRSRKNNSNVGVSVYIFKLKKAKIYKDTIEQKRALYTLYTIGHLVKECFTKKVKF